MTAIWLVPLIVFVLGVFTLWLWRRLFRTPKAHHPTHWCGCEDVGASNVDVLSHSTNEITKAGKPYRREWCRVKTIYRDIPYREVKS